MKYFSKKNYLLFAVGILSHYVMYSYKLSLIYWEDRLKIINKKISRFPSFLINEFSLISFLHDTSHCERFAIEAHWSPAKKESTNKRNKAIDKSSDNLLINYRPIRASGWQIYVKRSSSIWRNPVFAFSYRQKVENKWIPCGARRWHH